MTPAEEKFFHALTEKRKNFRYYALDDFAGKGIKDGVVKKYAGKGHFIYELLQNADDAGATKARFALQEDRLLFFHNGIRHFTISNPATENEDSKNGKIGDINAITAIGGSNKDGISTIGKFGVGFKSVFAYTNTPHVYDQNFCFKIEDFVVPNLLPGDHSERATDETLFVFPFNIKGAQQEILNALSNLIYPHLFLSHIESISYQTDRVYYKYVKKVLEDHAFVETDAKLLELFVESTEDKIPQKTERLWLFSRKFSPDSSPELSYSAGFFLNKDGKLVKKSLPAFCYFPTRETTNLNFIIHAPFLLTDSRANILADEPHNNDMVQRLAVLAADSLEFLKEIGEEKGRKLIDDDILDIIPYDPLPLTPKDSAASLSFLPFYTEIQNKFKKAAILPSRESYTDSTHAYWADEPEMAALFSNEQLAIILNQPQAAWAFPSRGRNSTSRTPLLALRDFIDSLTHSYINDNHLLKGLSGNDGKTRTHYITDTFIESQTLEWLDKFYQWLLRSKERYDSIKNLPIFLNQNRRAVAINDEKGAKNLFLPDGIESDYNTVHPDLDQLESAKNLLKHHNVEKPAAKDRIYKNVLSQYYNQVPSIDPEKNFKAIFEYYKRCPQKDLPELLDRLREIDWLCFRKESVPLKRFPGKAGQIYYPTEDLKIWFASMPDARFLDVDFYNNIIQWSETALFNTFLGQIGVNFSPIKLERIIEAPDQKYEYPYYEVKQQFHESKDGRIWKENMPHGGKEILKNIASEKDRKTSLALWKFLLQEERNHTLIEYLRGEYHYYFYRKDRVEPYDSYFKHLLLTTKWLCDKENNFVAPGETAASQLHPEYFQGDGGWEICRILNIPEELSQTGTGAQPVSAVEAEGMKLGLNEAEMLAALKAYAERKEAKAKPAHAHESASQSDEGGSQSDNEMEPEENVIKKAARALKRLRNRSSEKKGCKSEEPDNAESTYEENQDVDEFTPVIANLQKKMENAREKAEKELEELASLQELHQNIASFQKYSYGWLKSLLELEILENKPNSLGSREVSIDFFKVEREADTERTVILSQPSRNIPRMMEELIDIPLVLTLVNGDKIPLPIEVIHVKSYTLKVKLRPGKKLDQIDFTEVIRAHIEAQSPAFLLGELQKSFIALAIERKWEDDYNFRQNLPPNMEFIFGPPGTGKSTRLASKIHTMLEDTRERPLNILILCPTNKACDVIVNRLMSWLPENASLPEWLIRFGVTGDENIEKTGILKPRTFDISSLHNMVVVTTIARLPYDYFIMKESGEKKYLRDLGWDYVIIDEASMIHLPNVLYALFKCLPDDKFIIAGDPFQIQPIAAVDQWKDENIYTLVELNSFAAAKTSPINYAVERLSTQYRARPEIGKVFSNFIYNGILVHAREQSMPTIPPKDCKWSLSAINIIKFPVRKYESIYRSQRLNGGSPYHVYSALFTFELVKYLASLNWSANSGKSFSLGVIAPYRAQSDIVAKLLESFALPNGVEVQVGTIHSFQGDECDAIIALFNPPPGLSTSSKLFLNNPNIINVAISRARDYLFILMPDDATENLENLIEIKRLEELCKNEGCNVIEASAVEKLILGEGNWLEDNSFATTHHDVNVYRKPEKVYEIRCESMAVDLQVLPQGESLKIF